MTAIIDYGVGNLFSLLCSFRKIGEEAVVTSNPEDLKTADRIILPGVGAFSDAAKKFKNSGMREALFGEIEKGKPVLGICLGMQLLFDKSLEYGTHEGLHLIEGEIKPIPESETLKVPHMGWNALKIKRSHPLFENIEDGDFVYFVHSFYATDCEESTIAVSEYGVSITAAVAKNNVMGCQFHPEKSGRVGLKILRAFVKMQEGNI